MREKMRRADRVIWNDSSLAVLEWQIQRVLEVGEGSVSERAPAL
jgi:dephospho-CoA kinase